MMLRGRRITSLDLHCGHSIDFGWLPGASKSAIQSSKQASWAFRAHGHGDRHIEVVGVSSVSSAKHIQQILGSLLIRERLSFGLSEVGFCV